MYTFPASEPERVLGTMGMIKAESAAATRVRSNLADGLVRQLADDIIEGRLAPGFHLDENDLAARFRVSRTPVREALTQLCAMGLAERRPHRGVLVAILSPVRLTEMFEAMAELEAVMAGLAATNMTAGERHRLEAFHLRSRELVAAGATEEYAAANTRFHTLIYEGAHNGYLLELVSQTRRRLAPFRRAQFNLLGRLGKSFAEHDMVVKAILCGDGQNASQTMRRHVQTVREATASYVESRALHVQPSVEEG